MRKDNCLCVVISNFGTLWYGYRGDKAFNHKIRTYDPDALDPRVLPFKRALTAKQVAKVVLSSDAAPIITTVETAKRVMSLKYSDFAPVI